MLKIVIVVDDPFLASIYEHKLRGLGCTVECAVDGREGYDLILSVKPDLVLLDLLLPILPGADLIEALRAKEEFKDLPVIIVSGSTSGALLGAARRANALYLLPKDQRTPNLIEEKVRELIAAKSRHAAGDGSFAPPPPAPDTLSTPQAPLASRRVLVVEDDALAMSVLRDVIEKEGYTVVTAQNGREAYKILERDADFAAGIFDVQMPFMEGPELLRRMRGSERTAKIPVMVMTSEPSADIEAESFAAGAALFVAKPFGRAELLTKFHQLVNSRAA
jgi:CheY-like chemotaxis protein